MNSQPVAHARDVNVNDVSSSTLMKTMIKREDDDELTLTLNLSSSSLTSLQSASGNDGVTLTVSVSVNTLARAIAQHLRDAPDTTTAPAPIMPTVSTVFPLANYFPEEWIDHVVSRWQERISPSITKPWLAAAITAAGLTPDNIAPDELNTILKTTFIRMAEQMRTGTVKNPAGYARKVLCDVATSHMLGK